VVDLAGEAASLALERFRDLGTPVKDPYVVTVINRDFVGERRLQVMAGAGGHRQAGLRRWQPPFPVAGWQVIVYAPGARNFEWTYLADISFAGEILAARLRLDRRRRRRPSRPRRRASGPRPCSCGGGWTSRASSRRRSAASNSPAAPT